MNLLPDVWHTTILPFISPFSLALQRAKPPKWTVLSTNPLGKGLTPRACMGDEDSIWCAPGLTCETGCLYFSTRNTATAMILFAAIISVVSVVHVVVSSPQQCYYCVEDDCETMSLWINQTCATSQRSLGTSHCGTAAVRYHEGYLGTVPLETMVKGCFDCAGNYKNLVGCLVCLQCCHCFCRFTHKILQ